MAMRQPGDEPIGFAGPAAPPLPLLPSQPHVRAYHDCGSAPDPQVRQWAHSIMLATRRRPRASSAVCAPERAPARPRATPQEGDGGRRLWQGERAQGATAPRALGPTRATGAGCRLKTHWPCSVHPPSGRVRCRPAARTTPTSGGCGAPSSCRHIPTSSQHAFPPEGTPKGRRHSWRRSLPSTPSRHAARPAPRHSEYEVAARQQHTVERERREEKGDERAPGFWLFRARRAVCTLLAG
eukprot:scaffold20262_cov115-Isochrysis_galbana.AAC.1